MLRINSIRHHHLHCPIVELVHTVLNDPIHKAQSAAEGEPDARPPGHPGFGFGTRTVEERKELLEWLAKSEKAVGAGSPWKSTSAPISAVDHVPTPRLVVAAPAASIGRLHLFLEALGSKEGHAFVLTEWQREQTETSPRQPQRWALGGYACVPSILLPLFADEGYCMSELMIHKAAAKRKRQSRVTAMHPAIQDLRMAWHLQHALSAPGVPASEKDVQSMVGLISATLDLVRQAVKNINEEESQAQWTARRAALGKPSVTAASWRSTESHDVFIASLAKMWGQWEKLELMLAKTRASF